MLNRFRDLLFPGSSVTTFFDTLENKARQEAETIRSARGLKRAGMLSQDAKDERKRTAEIQAAAAREATAHAEWTAAREALRELEEANERLSRQAMLRIQNLGFSVVNTTHDEVMVLVPDDAFKDDSAARILAEMTRTPSWLPGIPLAAEGHLSLRYEK